MMAIVGWGVSDILGVVFWGPGFVGRGMGQTRMVGVGWMDGWGLKRNRNECVAVVQGAGRAGTKEDLHIVWACPSLSPNYLYLAPAPSPLSGRRRGSERAGGHVAQCPGGCRWGGPVVPGLLGVA